MSSTCHPRVSLSIADPAVGSAIEEEPIARFRSPYRHMALFRATIEQRVPSPGHTRASSSPPHSAISPEFS